ASRRITRSAVVPRAWSTSSSSGARTGRRPSRIPPPRLSEANRLSDEDDVDAAGDFLVDLENLPDLGVLPVGGERPRILERQAVLIDPLACLLRAGDELLRADDEDDVRGAPHRGSELAAGGRGDDESSIAGDRMNA